MKKSKQSESNLQLKQIAMEKKGLLALSGALSIISAALSFVPYICVYFIIREVLLNLRDSTAVLDGRVSVIALWALLGTTAGLVLSFASTMCSHVAAFDIIYRLRMRCAAHLANLPMGYHTTNATGKIQKIMNDNIGKVESFIAHQLPDMIGSAASPIFMIILLFVFDWRLGIPCLLAIVIAFVAQAKGMAKPKTREFMAKFQIMQEEINHTSVEYIRGMSVIKAFGQTVFSFKKFHDVIMKNQKLTLDYSLSVKNNYCAFLVTLSSIFLFLLPVGIFIGSRAADYQAFALSFIFYMIFSTGLSGPIMKLLYVFTNSYQVNGSIARIDSILTKPEQEEGADSQQPENCTICFEHVGFSYEEEQEQATLTDISFTAPEGCLTALVGPSGSGKTTIAQLIPRFWDISQGCIKIGGVDIREMTMETLMSQLSFVFQDVFLFKKSILDNIKMGNGQATDADAIAAAKAAMCHDFIMKLPKGYETVFGKDGAHFSGGEMQRIVIARAILKDAPIVILDEATAFADPENEQKIQTALQTLMKGKTVLVIAHRLSTIKGADQIIVVDDGKIVESGTHERLIEQGPKYQKMWAAYSRALSWKITKGDGVSC